MKLADDAARSEYLVRNHRCILLFLFIVVLNVYSSSTLIISLIVLANFF